MTVPRDKRKYSYADYLTWAEGGRLEIIDGKIHPVSPVPSRKHQEVLRELSVAFSLFLRDKEGEIFFAPFEVRLLSEDKQEEDIINIVQPDLTVVCDGGKLTEKGCNGSPDMIAEVLLPASVKLDRWQKYQLYEKAGVKEYWIVDVFHESVEVHLLQKGQYVLQGIFIVGEQAEVDTLPGLHIDLGRIFG